MAVAEVEFVGVIEIEFDDDGSGLAEQAVIAAHKELQFGDTVISEVRGVNIKHGKPKPGDG